MGGGIGDRVHFVHLRDARIRDPDGHVEVTDARLGPDHEAPEDRALLDDQHYGEGQPAEQHEILRAISEEHSECDVVHVALSRLGRDYEDDWFRSR